MTKSKSNVKKSDVISINMDKKISLVLKALAESIFCVYNIPRHLLVPKYQIVKREIKI